MKAEFIQSHRHPRFYVLCFLAALTVICGFLSKNMVIISALILFIPFWLPYFRRYRITDEDVLENYGIPVRSIRKLVYQKDRVDVYYVSGESEKMIIQVFFPVDKKGFVGKLKEINPHIQVI